MECPSRKVQLLWSLESSLGESEFLVALTSLRGFLPPGSKLSPDDRPSKSLNSSIGGGDPGVGSSAKKPTTDKQETAEKGKGREKSVGSQGGSAKKKRRSGG